MSTTGSDLTKSRPTQESSTRTETTHPPPVTHKQPVADEFQIAADLTLYANPLRCLHHKKSECGTKDLIQNQQNQGKSLPEEAAEEAGDIIAADLTMYGSPLDDN